MCGQNVRDVAVHADLRGLAGKGVCAAYRFQPRSRFREKRRQAPSKKQKLLFADEKTLDEAKALPSTSLPS